MTHFSAKRILTQISLGAGLWAAVSLVYMPVYGSFFLSDDFPLIAAVRADVKPWYSYLTANMVGERSGGIYRPLVRFSLLLNERAGGLDPRGYYAFNIFVHALVAYLAGVLAYQIIQRHKTAAAAAAALAFALAGNHGEAVNWISSRGDTLAALCMVGALLCHLRFRARGAYRWMCGALALFGLGLLSKEMAITAPFLFCIIDIFYARTVSWRAQKRWALYAACAVLAGAYLLMRNYTTHIVAGYYNQPELRLHAEKMIRAGIGLAISNFANGFERAHLLAWALRHILLSYIVLCASAALLSRAVRSEYAAFTVSMGFLIITALPILNLGLSSATDESERFAYVPSVGFALLMGIAARYAAEFLSSDSARRYALGVCMAGGISIFVLYQGYATYQKSQVWRTAGDDARALLDGMSPFVSDARIASGGIVVLGVPDNISGAYVFRNGLFDALKLRYPSYAPDLLPAKVNLRVRAGFSREDSDLAWSALPDGTGFTAHAQSNARALYGEAKGASADYEIGLKNYDPTDQSGDGLYITFTPQFLSRVPHKQITFLAFERGRLTQVFLASQIK